MNVIPTTGYEKDRLFTEGINFFNRGLFWEAHEVWEKIWLRTARKDAEGLFLAGMIQYAAGLLKIDKKEFEIGQKMARKALEQLKNKWIVASIYDFDLDSWIPRAKSYLDDITPMKFPFIQLELTFNVGS